MEKIKLCLSGSQQNGLEENLIRPICERLYDILTSDNLIDVELLPLYDGNDESALWQAIQASNNMGADYHLAIHADAGYSATGATGLYYSENGKNFITPITQEIMNATPWADIGIRRRTDLGELKNTNAVAGLIELSFYDNSEELSWMQNSVNEIAELLRTGIYKALNIEKPVSVDWQQKYYALRYGIQDILNNL